MGTALATPDLSSREQELVALSDEALVRRAYRFVDKVTDHDLSDEMYAVLTEVFERFAPRAEWANQVENYERTEPNGERRVKELAASRESMLRRAAGRVLAQTVVDATSLEQRMDLAEARTSALTEQIEAAVAALEGR